MKCQYCVLELCWFSFSGHENDRRNDKTRNNPRRLRCYRNDFLNITYSSKDQGSGSSSLGDVRVSVFCEKLSVFKQPWLFELYRTWQRFQSIFHRNIAGVLFTQKTTWSYLRTDVFEDKGANKLTARLQRKEYCCLIVCAVLAVEGSQVQFSRPLITHTSKCSHFKLPILSCTCKSV